MTRRRQRRRMVGTAVCLWLLIPAAPARLAAQTTEPLPAAPSSQPPLVHSIELGFGIGGYDRGLGGSNDQFVRYRVSRTDDFALVVDGGHEHRFAEDTARAGVWVSKTLRDGPTISAGWSSGTGQVLAPRYRVDFGVMHAINGVLTTATYTRVQSKTSNASNGVSVSAVRYFEQWIVSGNARVDVGSPGRTVSPSVGFGATWYRWKRLYVGADVTWGSVSYLLLPDQPTAVDYQSLTGGLTVSRWFTDHSGLNVRGTFGSTDIFRTGGVTSSVFWEF